MIKLIKSTFFNEEITKIKLGNFIQKSTQLSFGTQCELFEKNFAAWQKRKYCIFVNSGSSANLALIQAFINLNKVKKGDLVGVSSLTWSTNVMPLIELGLVPVPIDVELDTLNVSSKKLLEVLRAHSLKMLFITNLLGLCDDIDEITKICHERKITLIEDNCESLGTIYKNKKLGNFGAASTFSFYVGHHMSTIEGGAICTDNKKLADMLRIIRAHGWDRNLNKETQTIIRKKNNVNSSFYSRYTFYDLGYNLRPTEINGFIGNIQLKYLPEIIKRRNTNFFKIAPAIYKKNNLFYDIKYSHIDFFSNFAIPIICKSRKIRDEFVAKCNGKLEIRPIVGGDVTKQPFFIKHVNASIHNPNANLIHEQGFYFGNNPELTNNELREIAKIFS